MSFSKLAWFTAAREVLKGDKAAREILEGCETAGEALTYNVWVGSLPELQSSSGFCSMWSKVRGFIADNIYLYEYLISCLIILSLFRMARPSLCHTGFEFRRSPRALALALAFQIQGKQGGTLQGDPELNLVVQVPSNNENPLTIVKQWHCRNVNQH